MFCILQLATLFVTPLISISAFELFSVCIVSTTVVLASNVILIFPLYDVFSSSCSWLIYISCTFVFSIAFKIVSSAFCHTVVFLYPPAYIVGSNSFSVPPNPPSPAPAPPFT